MGGGGESEYYVIVTKGNEDKEDPQRQQTSRSRNDGDEDDGVSNGGKDLALQGNESVNSALSSDEFVMVKDPKSPSLLVSTMMESTLIPREELELPKKSLAAEPQGEGPSVKDSVIVVAKEDGNAEDQSGVTTGQDGKDLEVGDDWCEDVAHDDQKGEGMDAAKQQDFLMVSGMPGSVQSEENPLTQEEVVVVPEEMLQSTHRGLSNKFGENNCFLNGVLQVLWHNKTFRKCLLSVQHHVCQSSEDGQCVYCQLKGLFMEYQFSDSAQIPSTAVRKTLAIIYKPEHKFQLNAMDDAAECLEAILQRVHNDLVLDQKKALKDSARDDALRREITCNPACIAHNVFGMNVLEQSVCSCGSTTEPLCYSTFVQYFSVDELMEMAQGMTKPLPDGWERRTTPTGQGYFVNHRTKKSSWQAPPGCDIGDSPGYSFSLLLHTVSINNLVVCPNEACKKRNPIYRTLLNIPKAVSIGLTWTSDQVKNGQIHEFMKLIQTNIDLKSTFNATAIEIDPSHGMALRGMVCYYGHHYVAFNFSVSFQTWLMFDDANVVEVGPTFAHVIQKCARSTYQPSLLFYETAL